MSLQSVADSVGQACADLNNITIGTPEEEPTDPQLVAYEKARALIYLTAIQNYTTVAVSNSATIAEGTFHTSLLTGNNTNDEPVNGTGTGTISIG